MEIEEPKIWYSFFYSSDDPVMSFAFFMPVGFADILRQEHIENIDESSMPSSKKQAFSLKIRCNINKTLIILMQTIRIIKVHNVLISETSMFPFLNSFFVDDSLKKNRCNVEEKLTFRWKHWRSLIITTLQSKPSRVKLAMSSFCRILSNSRS